MSGRGTGCTGSVLSTGILSLSWLAGDLLVVGGLLVYDRFVAAQPIAWSRRSR